MRNILYLVMIVSISKDTIKLENITDQTDGITNDRVNLVRDILSHLGESVTSGISISCRDMPPCWKVPS